MDKTVRVWGVESLSCLFVLCGHTGSVRAVHWSPDGLRIASGSADHSVRVWSAEGAHRECLFVLQGHSESVSAVAWSPCSRFIVSGSGEKDANLNRKYNLGFQSSRGKTLRLWEAATGLPLSTFSDHKNWALSVSWHPEGTFVVSTGSFDETVRVWDAGSCECTSTLLGHRNWVQSVDCSPSGRYFATGSSDSTVRLWDASLEDSASTLLGTAWNVSAVRWGGSKIFSCCVMDSTVKVWEPDAGVCVATLQHRQLRAGGRAVRALAVSPDGCRIASGSDEIRLWSAATEGPCEVAETVISIGEKVYANCLAWSPNGQFLASGTDNYRDVETIKVWDAGTGLLVAAMQHKISVCCVDWSPCGLSIVSSTGSKVGASDSEPIRIWSALNGEIKSVIRNPSSGFIEAVAWKPVGDGRWLATGSTNRMVQLWDTRSFAPGAAAQRASGIVSLRGHTGSVKAVHWSPDGLRIASGSADHSVRVWSAEGAHRACLIVLQGHFDPVTSVAWSPCSRFIVSGSWDRSIRIWDVVLWSEGDA